MRQAGIFLDFAPDLAPHVVAGEVSLDAAYRQGQAARDAQRLRTDEAAARAYLEDNAPELAEVVADGTYGSYREVVRAARAMAEERARGEGAGRLAQRQARATYEGLARTARTLAQLDAVPVGVDGLMEAYEPSATEAGATDLEPDTLRRAAHFLAQLVEWAERRGSEAH